MRVASNAIVLAASLALAACHAPRPSAPRAPSEATTTFRVAASRPATVWWALDAAAGGRNRDPGYRAWLEVDGELPPWLSGYAARRRAWDDVAAFASDNVSAFDACALDAVETRAFVGCVERLLEPEDARVARTAIEAADRAVAARWDAQAPRLRALTRAVEEGIVSEDGRRLLRTLRAESALDDDQPLEFTVVLLAKPDGPHTFASQRDAYLVHEVGDVSTAGSLLAVAFHEIAHLAHALSPRRAAMERGFLPFGERGLFAAAHWDEVLAAAYGNGLAAERFDPDYREDASYYDDPIVDRLARALHQRWRAGADVVLGPELAAELVALADREVPEGERSVDRYLWYATVYAQDREAASAVLEGIPYRGASRITPIDDALTPSEDLPLWAPCVVVLDAAELAARPALAAQLELDLATVDAALTPTGAAVFRSPRDGATTLAVVARAAADRAGAARALRYVERFPAPGWTPL